MLKLTRLRSEIRNTHNAAQNTVVGRSKGFDFEFDGRMMDDENNRLCSREERMMSHTVSIVYSTKGRRDSLPLEMTVRLCYRSTKR